MKTQNNLKKSRKRDILLILLLLGNTKSVEPGYNELGLRGTSPVASDIL